MRRLKTLCAIALVGLAVLLPVGAAQADLPPGYRNLNLSTQTGVYYLQFRHSSKCIAIPGSVTTVVQLHQWGCFATTSEQWSFHQIAMINGIWYGQIKSVHSGLCMNVSGDSDSNGAAIVQYQCTTDPPTANEDFAFIADEDVPTNYWWVQARSSRKVLNIANASTDNAAKLVQFTSCNCENEYIRLCHNPTCT